MAPFITMVVIFVMAPILFFTSYRIAKAYLRRKLWNELVEGTQAGKAWEESSAAQQSLEAQNQSRDMYLDAYIWLSSKASWLMKAKKIYFAFENQIYVGGIDAHGNMIIAVNLGYNHCAELNVSIKMQAVAKKAASMALEVEPPCLHDFGAFSIQYYGVDQTNAKSDWEHAVKMLIEFAQAT